MKTQVIILAAGKGKRMRGEIPKALIPLQGKPLLVRLLESVASVGFTTQPIVVVGENKPLIENVLSRVEFQPQYVLQYEQLGTGHAVQCARDLCEGAERVVVLYVDHPLISPATIRSLCEVHAQGGGPLTLATALAPDFEGVHTPFADFGRIIRDSAGAIVKIVEKKDASPEELAVREVNPAYFCFTASWLWRALATLNNNNAQNEYYLTDTVQCAMREGYTISSVAIAPYEALGINTPEHLAAIESLIAARTI